MTDYEKALITYTDEDGLILSSPNTSDGPETGNGLFNLAIAEIIRARRGENEGSEHMPRVIKIIKSCEVYPFKGIYHRGPRKTKELQAHDDYIAIAALSLLFDLHYGEDICLWGTMHHWSFNNLEPSKWSFKTWFGRHPGFVPFMKECAGLELGCFESTLLNGKNWYSDKFGSTNARLLHFIRKLGNVDYSYQNDIGKYYGIGHPFYEFYP